MTHHAQSPLSYPVTTNSDRLETSDRMSKEKQKFFRLSAFNADKKRDKKQLSSPQINNKQENLKKPSNRNNQNKLHEEKKIEEFSDCSSSSEKETDLSSDTDSSLEPSSSRSNIKIPTYISSNTKKTETFGSISGITLDKDAPWGFAVAAAEVKKLEMTSNEPLTFATFKNQSTFSIDNNLNENGKSFFSSLVDDDVNSFNNGIDRAKSGLTQLRGLFDGLSHLFAANTENRSSRSTPNYNPSRRTKREEEVIEDVDKIKTKRNKATIKTATSSETKNIQAQPNPPILPISISNSFENYKSIMTPSNLVKTAVYSKRHEIDRRNFLKSEGKLGSVGFEHSSMTIVEDSRMKKRNFIAETAQTNHPLSVPPTQIANNQTGKIGNPNLVCQKYCSIDSLNPFPVCLA